MRMNSYICSMDFTKLIEILEKHISWRYIVFVGITICAFLLGSYYESSKRDKQEALLINQHTKDIKQYSDSAQEAKFKAIEAKVEYKIIIMSKDKTIDSLKSIIKSYEDGQDEK